MKTKAELASERFRAGMNCAQAVLTAFCEDYGMSQEAARAVAGSFGAGLRMGEVCGAASGGAMVIGLRCGQRAAEDATAKQTCNELAAQFMKEFRARNTCLTCRDLLRHDLSKPEQYMQAQEGGLFSTVCPNLVMSAVTLLGELGC